jgi:hypothetical protein
LYASSKYLYISVGLSITNWDAQPKSTTVSTKIVVGLLMANFMEYDPNYRIPSEIVAAQHTESAAQMHAYR